MIKIKLNFNLEKEIKKEAEKTRKTKIEILVKALKDATPVDTGRARDGWYATEDSIRNDVEYVKELNHGTSKQAPSHFIEKTLLSGVGVKPTGVIVKYTR